MLYSRPLKYLKSIVILLMIVLLAGYLFFRFGGYIFIKSDIKNNIVSNIQNSEQLPAELLEMYNQVYDKPLENSYLRYILNSFGNKSDNTCTCKESVLLHQADLPDNNNIYKILLISYLEDFVSPKECLQFNFHYGFHIKDCEGINEISKFYYNLDISELDKNQMLELIVMYKNPAYFDKNRRPEILKKQVDKLKERIYYENR